MCRRLARIRGGASANPACFERVGLHTPDVNRMLRCLRLGLVLCALLVCLPSPTPAELLPPGFRPRPLGVHAIVGGKVVTQPGEAIEAATIVIRNGAIEAVGNAVTPPADARR